MAPTHIEGFTFGMDNDALGTMPHVTRDSEMRSQDFTCFPLKNSLGSRRKRLHTHLFSANLLLPFAFDSLEQVLEFSTKAYNGSLIPAHLVN